ncbi:MAG: glycosyltransferase family 1 protein [Pseudomonadota bacterium]
MKIAIVTDAWRPQTNGVVTTLSKTAEALRELGHEVKMFTPEPFRTIPCPSYPEIRLSLFAGRKLRKSLDEFAPESIHIATEGPLGFAARRYCKKNKLVFTTSYHTQFPAYVRKRFPIPERWTWAFVRWFHNAAERTLAPTPAIVAELKQHGFRSPVVWGRGVDTELFRPASAARDPRSGPVYLYAGRVAVEKNLEAFTGLSLPGQKIIVGDGPDLKSLQSRFPDCTFTGYQFGQELAEIMASADVFVFPSRTDTFGLVMLEAMACGVPVAAYPVPGPIDVVRDGVTGILDEDLATACRQAIRLNRDDCRRHALENSWARCSEQFANYLVKCESDRSAAPATPSPRPESARHDDRAQH